MENFMRNVPRMHQIAASQKISGGNKAVPSAVPTSDRGEMTGRDRTGGTPIPENVVASTWSCITIKF